MGIQIYNSLTNRKEAFEPLAAGKVGIYLCGPTVYKPSHIGHAVGPIIFDTIKRYLVHRGYEVTWVVNITDVDDKLITEAAEHGMTVPQLAEQVTANYMNAMQRLSVRGIDHWPKASEHVGDIIEMIRRLVERGGAYPSDGDVYFDVAADADYGKLSNRRSEEQSGHRDLQGGGKRNPGDFALWKGAKPDEPDEVKWDSPWGQGRPGWHIECSAMAVRYLGETFDIHGGGLDLIFPHHENEIAQSETCSGKPFAKYWMHHGLTRFNTKKVSKSDPKMREALAQMTLSTLLERYSGELLRYFVLSTQYRRPIEYSPEQLAEKRKALATFYRLFERVEELCGRSVYACADARTDDGVDANMPSPLAEALHDARERFEAAMDDDFNTAVAIAVLFDMANAINRFIEDHGSQGTDAAASAAASLVRLARLLGLFESPHAEPTAGSDVAEKLVQLHLELRQACREADVAETADVIGSRLKQIGVVIEEHPDGPRWRLNGGSGDRVDQLMNALIDVRAQLRSARAFALADLIRDRLGGMGITLEDKPTGSVWHLQEA